MSFIRETITFLFVFFVVEFCVSLGVGEGRSRWLEFLGFLVRFVSIVLEAGV